MPTTNKYGQATGREVKDWIKKKLPEKITLRGSYCSVSPLQVDHAEDLFPEWQSIDDDRDWTYLKHNKPATKEACYQFFRNLCAEPGSASFVVKDNNDDVIKGIFSTTSIDPDSGVFEIAEINWTPQMKRTRMSTEALYLIASYFFDNLNYRRCEWRTNNLNEQAINSAQRFGFLKEGILRDKRIIKGHAEDIAIFSITATDWPEISSSLKAWLRNENFDGRGKQIKKLSEFRLS